MQLLWNLIAHFLLIKWKLKIIFSYILALSHIDNGTIEKQLSSCLADFVVKQNLPYHPPPSLFLMDNIKMKIKIKWKIDANKKKSTS